MTVIQTQDLEALLTTALETTAPTIALAVYHRGERVLHRAYGYLDPETRTQPTQLDTLFDLASVTKMFTTSAFLSQMAEGKITLETRVVQWIPEFGATGMRPIGDMQDPHTLALTPPAPDLAALGPIDPTIVTFHHLLTHTGGLAPWRNIYQTVGSTPPPPGHPEPVVHPERLQKALHIIGDCAFVNVPGREVCYSDLGLIMLGAAVARIDKAATLADVIDERVIKPAGLTNTRYNPPNAADCAPTELDTHWRQRRCQGEVHDENACGLGGIAGHAGMFGTADDVARIGVWWLDALAGRGGLPQAIAQEAIKLQAVTGVDRRGLGWVLRTPGSSSSGKYFSDSSFGHTGFTGTSLWIDPEREVVVALMTNRVYLGRQPNAIMELRPKVHDAVMTLLGYNDGGVAAAGS